MSVSRIAVGGLMLDENSKWIFTVESDVIVGRRQNDEGILRIRHVQSNTLPGRVTHEFCLEMACRMLNVPDDPIADIKALNTPWGPYGAATFAGNADVRRVWYCNRPPGLIVGVYGCPVKLSRDGLYRIIRGECDRIMAGAIFDRPSWGGDDPLTRILIDDSPNSDP